MAGQLDARLGTLRLASAGHLGPVVSHRGAGCLPTARPGGPPLGLVREQRYPEAKLRLHAGDLILFATDGISDRFAARGDWSGETGLAARLARLGTEPSAICRRLLWDGPSGGNADATALVMQLREGSAPRGHGDGPGRHPPLRLAPAARAQRPNDGRALRASLTPRRM